MTGPAFGGTGRGTGAPSRATGTRETVGAVLVVLAAGLALRLIIAYLIPGSGFGVDIGAFRFWASNLASQGPSGFYQRDFFHDYTPGYLYVLWVVGIVGNLVGGVGDLIKVPPILADLAIGWLAWSMVRELGGRRRLALGRRRGRRDQPDLLVRQRRLGPGRLVRGRLPPARPARAVARPARAGGDLHGHRRGHQAAARDPHPAGRGGDDPARPVARRRASATRPGPVARSGS